MEEPVWMARMNLDGFHQALLPTGCGIRTYHSGDEWHWLYIIRQANPGRQYRNAAFQHAFASHAGELSRRLLFFVNAQGKDIGTAAVLPDDIWQDARSSLLCHVALLSEGLDFKEVLIRAALERMIRLGHSRAYVAIGTEDIGLYASLGFQPLIREAGDKKTWDTIKTTLPWPGDREFAPIGEKDWIRKRTGKQMA